VAETWDDTAGMRDTAIYRVFEPGHLCQHIEFASLPDRTIGDEPFTLSATASSGLAVSFTASGSCTVSGNEVTLTGGGVCTLTAVQVGDERFGPADEVSQSFHVLFDFTGFLSPIENAPAFNRAVAGRALPIRFALAGDAGNDVLAEGSPAVRHVSCETLAPLGEFEPAIGLGSKSLFHRNQTGRYLYAWKTRRAWAGTCRELALGLVDGTVHSAYFRFPGESPVGRPDQNSRS
ncbi:MAG: PxKF domain-containing protein, partial [Candidatus Rokuibacteriota bacterium]